MYTKKEITDKLDALKFACEESGNTTVVTPAGPLVVTGKEKAAVLEPVYAAVNDYYAYDDALRTQVMYVIHQLYGDLMRRHTVYFDGPVPPCREDYPAGYSDVTSLFNGSGVLPEIMDIASAVFVSSISIDTAGTVSSPLVGNWRSRIWAARAGEIAELETLLNFCKSGGFEGGLYVAFEEYEKVKMPLKKKDLARIIYLEKGFAELIATLNLNIPLPSYLSEF